MSLLRKKTILIVLMVFTVLAVSGLAGTEYYTSQPEFCGLCHTVEKPFDSWAKSGHEDANCVDCHFAPGKESILEANLRGIEQVFEAVFPDAEATAEVGEVQIQSKASSISCSTSQCHPGKKSLNRRINSAENVPFTHKPHNDGIIEGKTLNCGTCHTEVKAAEDYAVSSVTCYFCNGFNHILEVYY